jgi:hypothetical protein
MRTFAQKPKAPQQAKPAKPTIRGRAHFGQTHEVNSILHLQRTIGNQAVLRLLQANAEERNTGSATTASTRFAHDFSRIPIHPPGAGAIQTKLMVNTLGDIYEQEADRIADQVMATPAHHAVNGVPPRIQRFSGQSTRQADAAPTSVDQALASPGRLLEPALRQDMEPRFGYDFSRVRLHTDAAAQQSARDMNAYAYTVGHNMVFGAGKFAPGTQEGRRLIAHELTHVVQQSGSDGIRVNSSNEKHGLSPRSGLAAIQEAAGNMAIQRTPREEGEEDAPVRLESALNLLSVPAGAPAKRKPARKARRELDDPELKALAQWPGDAHRVWKRLTGRERVALLTHMSNRYGTDFSNQFYKFTETGAKDEYLTFAGPFPEYTPEWFRQHGYRLVQKGLFNQWWTQPSGRVMMGQFGAAGEVRAAEIADQKAFEAVLAKAGKAVAAAKLAESKVRSMETFFTVGSASDDDRPQHYGIYQETLEDMDSQAEAAQIEAQNARAKYAAKRVDVSAINPLIDELAGLGVWAATRLGQDIWAPTSKANDNPLPPATDEPMDYSGKGTK